MDNYIYQLLLLALLYMVVGQGNAVVDDDAVTNVKMHKLRLHKDADSNKVPFTVQNSKSLCYTTIEGKE